MKHQEIDKMKQGREHRTFLSFDIPWNCLIYETYRSRVNSRYKGQRIRDNEPNIVFLKL